MSFITFRQCFQFTSYFQIINYCFPLPLLQDFGKYPRMRTFIQEYIQALSSQNDGKNAVGQFVKW